MECETISANFKKKKIQSEVYIPYLRVYHLCRSKKENEIETALRRDGNS